MKEYRHFRTAGRRGRKCIGSIPILVNCLHHKVAYKSKIFITLLYNQKRLKPETKHQTKKTN